MDDIREGSHDNQTLLECSQSTTQRIWNGHSYDDHLAPVSKAAAPEDPAFGKPNPGPTAVPGRHKSGAVKRNRRHYAHKPRIRYQPFGGVSSDDERRSNSVRERKRSRAKPVRVTRDDTQINRGRHSHLRRTYASRPLYKYDRHSTRKTNGTKPWEDEPTQYENDDGEQQHSVTVCGSADRLFAQAPYNMTYGAGILEEGTQFEEPPCRRRRPVIDRGSRTASPESDEDQQPSLAREMPELFRDHRIMTATKDEIPEQALSHLRRYGGLRCKCTAEKEVIRKRRPVFYHLLNRTLRLPLMLAAPNKDGTVQHSSVKMLLDGQKRASAFFIDAGEALVYPTIEHLINNYQHKNT